MQVVGVDGTKGGWVAIALENGRFASDLVIRPIESDFSELAGASVIAVDVPIGYGPRQADPAARAFLRGAASTVFTTPREDQLRVPFGPGLGLSAQSHALGPRIIHLTELANQDRRLFEVHPEVSFRAMNDRQPLRNRKKSSGGALERIDLLHRHGIDLARLDATKSMPLDDVLDAAAAAWSAHRILAGNALTLPDPPEQLDGRQIAIWY